MGHQASNHAQRIIISTNTVKLCSIRAYNDACIRARYRAICFLAYVLLDSCMIVILMSVTQEDLGQSFHGGSASVRRNWRLLVLVMALWRKLEVPTTRRVRRSSVDVFARCFVKDAKADGTNFLTEK